MTLCHAAQSGAAYRRPQVSVSSCFAQQRPGTSFVCSIIKTVVVQVRPLLLLRFLLIEQHQQQPTTCRASWWWSCSPFRSFFTHTLLLCLLLLLPRPTHPFFSSLGACPCFWWLLKNCHVKNNNNVHACVHICLLQAQARRGPCHHHVLFCCYGCCNTCWLTYASFISFMSYANQSYRRM